MVKLSAEKTKALADKASLRIVNRDLKLFREMLSRLDANIKDLQGQRANSAKIIGLLEKQAISLRGANEHDKDDV